MDGRQAGGRWGVLFTHPGQKVRSEWAPTPLQPSTSLSTVNGPNLGSVQGCLMFPVPGPPSIEIRNLAILIALRCPD